MPISNQCVIPQKSAQDASEGTAVKLEARVPQMMRSQKGKGKGGERGGPTTDRDRSQKGRGRRCCRVTTNGPANSCPPRPLRSAFFLRSFLDFLEERGVSTNTFYIMTDGDGDDRWMDKKYPLNRDNRQTLLHLGQTLLRGGTPVLSSSPSSRDCFRDKAIMSRLTAAPPMSLLNQAI